MRHAAYLKGSASMRRLPIFLASFLCAQAVFAAGASAEPSPPQRFDAAASALSCGGDRPLQEVSLDEFLIVREVGAVDSPSAELQATLISDCVARSGDAHACRTPASSKAEATYSKRLLVCWTKRRAEG